MYRKTYALINNDILETNVKNIRKEYPDYQYYFGVVKNNAYNHGIHIIPALIKGGINYLAVSSLDEALEIRKYYIDIPILILEPIDIDDILVACNNDLTIAIDNLEYVKKLALNSYPKELKIHMIIDSGMNRLGFNNRLDINEAYKIIKNKDNLLLEGLFTHYATSGFIDKYYDIANNKLDNLLKDIDLSEIPIIHFDRSLTLIRHKKNKITNGVRLGILMYGYNSIIKYGDNIKDQLRCKKRDKILKRENISETILENNLVVKPAFSLYSQVISLRKAQKGDIVGYDALFKCDKDMLIATVSIGYADGVNKHFGNVAINGVKYPIISDCMDMLMVKVDENVHLNDEVEIFGNTISQEEVCKTLGINAYHLYSMISSRVVRVHIENNEKSEIKY